MLEAILAVLKVMGWTGIAFGILVATNTSTGTLINIWANNEVFSWSRMFKGIGKSIIFYVGAVFVNIALTMLPYINEMVMNVFGTQLLGTETLTNISSAAVIGIIGGALAIQGKKAIQNIMTLSKVSSNTEEITWEVIEEEE